MSTSDSDLSTPPATEDEMPMEVVAPKATKPTPQKKKKKNGNILSFFDKAPPSPPRKKRAPSPPHETVPEDNPDIAFIVMFRSRFSDAFPSKCPHLGPQDLERGIAGDLPTPEIESLLCALLGLVNNRKKPVEKGHYGRALEEAVQTQRNQWPRSWNNSNPLHGGRNFNNMSPTDRLNLLKTLVLWSLNQSEIVNNVIKDTYKSRTTKDPLDTNIPLSVQPWGKDGDRRRYWLIEGQDDTNFRVYRETNPMLKKVDWWSVAGSIEELRTLATKLKEEDGTRDAKALSERMLNAIPRFEATEEKRKRREYRLARKAAFTRPEPGFSLYEGRTRGKRMRYTFSDNEEEDSEIGGIRRSTRNSGRDSPAALTGPTVTASGRAVKSRAVGLYGESLLSGQTTERASPATGDYVRSDASEEPRPFHGRSTRAANRGVAATESRKRKHFETYDDDMDDEDDATSWDGGDEDEDEPDQMDLDEEEEESDEASDENDEPQSLIVRLKIGKAALASVMLKSTALPTTKQEDLVKTEGVSQQPAPAISGPPVTGMDGARTQSVLAPVPAPAATAELPQPPLPPPAPLVSNVATNGVPPQPVQPVALPPAIVPPVTSPAQVPVPPANDAPALPPLGSLFRAPTPPYSAQEAPKPQVQVQPVFPPSTTEAPLSPQRFANALPAPTPAANWQ